ncbi:MAG: hypothetical protein AAFY73_15215 [Pseudomonadota bacterium]
MRLVGTTIILAAAVAIGGCAKRPDAIAPAAVPYEAFANLTCAEIDQRLKVERATLADLTSKQHGAANADIAGVFLVGVPVGSAVGGNQEGKLAVSKGTVQTLEAARSNKSCDATG